MERTKLRRAGVAAACVLAALGAQAAEPGPHVHGQAALHVVAEGTTLELQMETPLDNVLGFEHAPRDDRERAAVRAMAARLRQPLVLLQPTPAAHCVSTGVRLASSAFAPGLLGEAADSKPAATEPGGHADLDATFTFYCKAPANLRGLDAAGLLKAFPGFHTLRVEVVGPRGQAAADLAAGRTAVRW